MLYNDNRELKDYCPIGRVYFRSTWRIDHLNWVYQLEVSHGNVAGEFAYRGSMTYKLPHMTPYQKGTMRERLKDFEMLESCYSKIGLTD